MNSPKIAPHSAVRSTVPTQDEIALRAHQRWCQQGCPQGHDLDNWLEAERELVEESASRSPSLPASEGVETLRRGRSDNIFSDLREDAPLGTKVEEQVLQPRRASISQSPTSLDL